VNYTEWAIGQRCISQAEPELGLGLVETADPRRLTLHFPAVQETRIYQRQSAPISRIRFQLGDRIRGSHHPQWSDRVWRVIAVDDQQSLLRYTLETESGLSTDDVQRRTVSEQSLPADLRFGSPDQRFASAQIDHVGSFDLFLRTLEQQARLDASPVHGLLGCRTQLLPHQIYIAHQVAQRLSPRLLLADEVGLGKTIEAGLILHQMLLNEQADRVLVLVPDSLVHQWLVEMQRRFNLTFSLFDLERFESLLVDEGNPFDSEQLILCPMSLLTEDDIVLAAALRSSWDLLVVDEAHHLEYSPGASSAEYLRVAALAEMADGLLLLTATPEQSGSATYFGLLQLLDPDRFYSLPLWQQEQAGFEQVNSCIRGLQDHDDEITAETVQQINQALGLEGDQRLDETLSRDELIESVLDRYGTGRVLFRNTRKAIGGFPERRLKTQVLPCPAAYLAIDEAVTGLYPERDWADAQRASQDEQISPLSVGWCEHDPRVDQLMGLAALLHQDVGDPRILVICHHAESAVELTRYLRDTAGLRCAAFHEHLTLIERDRAAAWFADTESAAQLLICSEMGSEGRNFQFAQHLVLFDLPPNPDLIEQRIGRLDRIGQQGDVNIHVWPLQGTAQEVLFRWMHEGLDLFQRSLTGGWGLYQSHRQALHGLMVDADETSLLSLIEQTAEQVTELLNAQQQGRDRLIELNSCRADVAEGLIRQIRLLEEGSDLTRFAHDLFDQLGIDHDVHSAMTDVIHPSDHLRIDHVPGLSEDGMTLTYDRTRALEREDFQFMSWEHPLMRHLMTWVLESGMGTACLGLLQKHRLPRGTVLIELVYQMDVMAPAALQLGQFLPRAPVRILLDQLGRELTDSVDPAKMTRHCQPVPSAILEAVIDQLKPLLTQCLERVSERLEPELSEARDQASAKLDLVLGHELRRLEALKLINPGIREDEVLMLTRRLDVSRTLVNKARFELKGLRLIVCA